MAHQTDFLTQFNNTESSFKSRNAMSFKFKGFRWDMADDEVNIYLTLFAFFYNDIIKESQIVKCTVSLDFNDDETSAVYHDQCTLDI